MKLSVLKEELIWRGEKYLLELFENTDFSKISPITQVYGFVFNKEGKILIIRGKNSDWNLPGGTPESYDKNWKETLIREVDEEANVEIDTFFPLGYIKSTSLSPNPSGKVGYALRIASNLKKMKERAIDPATGITNEIKFVSPSEFPKYCKWGKNGEVQLNWALKKFISQ